MKLSEAWLREWVDPPGGTTALADQLTMQGLEVDAITPAGAAIPHVVVARVQSLAPHPDAQRLRVCQVDSGNGVVQVVCGAANVQAGGLYPLALPGARLPGGAEIAATVLRGVPSSGMLCSATELGFAEAADGLLELDAELVPGTPLSSALKLDDQIIEINVTPNRADCFSVTGIARDVGAAANVPAKAVSVRQISPAITEGFAAALQAGPACPTLALRVIRDLAAGSRSPLWLRERLRRSGIRSIHPVVDVTNYVMLELGQPLHAYDLTRLQAPLTARFASAGERITILGGSEMELAPDVLVIADARGAVGIAGIMGGEASAVTAATTSIVLESAFFAPSAIAGRARRYGLQTDASMRFERGVDPAGQLAALERATELLLEIAGGRAGPIEVARNDQSPTRAVIALRRAKLHQVLGIPISDGEVEAILARLGMAIERNSAGWLVQAPTFRFDVEIEVDLIEEVARVYGYNRIPVQAGQQPTHPGTATEFRIPTHRARDLLVARGYQEAITYSFTDPVLDTLLAGGSAGVELVNPIASDLATLRQSLWPGLITALRYNLDRQAERVHLYEVGSVFLLQGSELKEVPSIGGIAFGARWQEQWAARQEPGDFFDIKSDVEALLALGSDADVTFKAEAHPALHPGRSARLWRGEQPVGWLGELHPAHVVRLGLSGAPLLFELALDPLLQANLPRVSLPSKFPAVRRDLAVLVARDLPVEQLRASVIDAAGSALQTVIVFDIYAGQGIDPNVKSVALGLILQETSRTLTDVEVDAIVVGVVRRLASDFNAKIRD